MGRGAAYMLALHDDRNTMAESIVSASERSSLLAGSLLRQKYSALGKVLLQCNEITAALNPHLVGGIQQLVHFSC